MATVKEGQRHDRNALILYGSETGNSQDMAETLGRIAERLHIMTRVSEMDLVEIVCCLTSMLQGLRTNIARMNSQNTL